MVCKYDCTKWRTTTADTAYSLYVYNKIDSVSLDFLDKLAREPDTVVMSCELDLGIQDVVERCWYELQLLRIYTKRSVEVHRAQLVLIFGQQGGRTRLQRSIDCPQQLVYRRRL